ncbi:unnamed protein product [Cylindrotheca closterium]|uniref:Uncharacterized protein n=1 Tax=Cylindrotheca closterium TaxID=2856 RepID=A0AAD2GDE5_9STRA|nr:unnamed protein product [Cylindrotheca closterium]
MTPPNRNHNSSKDASADASSRSNSPSSSDSLVHMILLGAPRMVELPVPFNTRMGASEERQQSNLQHILSTVIGIIEDDTSSLHPRLRYGVESYRSSLMGDYKHTSSGPKNKKQ